MTSTVHPRGCGEPYAPWEVGCGAFGSSPRVRGTPVPRLARPMANRFIPAGAGNPRTHSRPAIAGAVHPRGCGEPGVWQGSACAASGSSPRVRGTPDAPLARARPGRFIPAGAGNPLVCPIPCAISAVHPRGCGEPPVAFTRYAVDDGSSPRVRGTPTFCTTTCRAYRFIPAGAGNPECHSPRHDRAAVHPRGCGEPWLLALRV